MRFLHTGDLHLDSPFCSSDTVTAEEKRAAQRRTLWRIFELAEKQNCQMALISGDLFDSKYVTPETEKYVRLVFEKAGIPIVIAPGNHDPYVNGSFYSRADLPENVYVFNSSELQKLDFPELRTSVYGYAFTSPSLTRSPLAGAEKDDASENIRLLCAHADITSPISRYCPLTVGDITGLGIRYAALGHIHNRNTDDSAEGSIIRYCGFAEGRSFDELGDGGVFVVDCEEDGSVNYKRFTVSQQRYEIRELDVSGCAEGAEISARIAETAVAAANGTDTHLRICLTGTVDSNVMPPLDELSVKLAGDKLRTLEIKDMTVPVADIASLSADQSVKGEFYRALYSGLISDDPKSRERTALALRIGLAAIEGRRMTGGGDGI